MLFRSSKSKGNVVVPSEPIEKFGADAVRYWAASARLGTDAAYEIGEMKIGRRLAIKLLNATKFALAIGREDENHQVSDSASAVWDAANVTHPLDRSMMAQLASVVETATAALNEYDHAKALETIESFFWQFCDDYIELAKNRAYGTADATGNVPTEQDTLSARTTLGLGLDAFARLLAPYLPYATEEVYSWMHDGAGSVHRAAWPTAGLYRAAAGDADDDVLLWAGRALAALRKIKSEAKVSMKTPILSATLAVDEKAIALIESVSGDIYEAGKVTGTVEWVAADLTADNANADEITITTSELGEAPARKK